MPGPWAHAFLGWTLALALPAAPVWGKGLDAGPSPAHAASMPRHHRAKAPAAPSKAPLPGKPQAQAPASLGSEDLLDPKGYLGLRLGEAFPVEAVVARLGAPNWKDERDDFQGLKREHWVWEGPSPEADDGEFSPQALRVELAEDRPGHWLLDGLEVGAQFRIAPRVGGHGLDQAAALLAALPGHIDRGSIVDAHVQGLSLWRWGGQVGFRSAVLRSRLSASEEANTRAAAQALAQLKEGRGLPWPFSAPPSVPKGSVLAPARVVGQSPLPLERVGVRLRLPAGLLDWEGPDEQGPNPELLLKLDDGATARALRPGDLVLLRGTVYGQQGHSLVLALLRWEAAYPQGQAFPWMPLWDGAGLSW